MCTQSSRRPAPIYSAMRLVEGLRVELEIPNKQAEPTSNHMEWKHSAIFDFYRSQVDHLDLIEFKIQWSHNSEKLASALNIWVSPWGKWPGVSLSWLEVFLNPTYYVMNPT